MKKTKYVIARPSAPGVGASASYNSHGPFGMVIGRYDDLLEPSRVVHLNGIVFTRHQWISGRERKDEIINGFRTLIGEPVSIILANPWYVGLGDVGQLETNLGHPEVGFGIGGAENSETEYLILDGFGIFNQLLRLLGVSSVIGLFLEGSE